MRLTPSLLLATACVLVAVPAGDAQSDGARTVTVLQEVGAGTFKFIDAAPKSPSRNLASKRFRWSPGDVIVGRTPLVSTDGGDNIGTAYVDGTAAVGGRLATAVMVGRSVFKLRDGQIVLESVSQPGNNPESGGPIPIVGGSGAYEGARASGTTTVTAHGAQITSGSCPRSARRAGPGPCRQLSQHGSSVPAMWRTTVSMSALSGSTSPT